MRRQPPSVQTFLLRTSILERLSAALCDALLEQMDSQQMLEFLERANVFVVPLDGQRRWYRYHALFSQALRSRLEQTEGEAVAALHRRASQWYAQQGSLAAFLPDGTGPERAELSLTAHPLLDPLSQREREVLRLMVEGSSNQEITEALVVSINTVKRHVTNIFSKLGANNRVQAVTRARALGLLSDQP